MPRPFRCADDVSFAIPNENIFRVNLAYIVFKNDVSCNTAACIIKHTVVDGYLTIRSEKIHSPQLHGTVRFRSLDCDGTDERAPCLDGADADAPPSHATFDGANADAARANAKLRLRLPPFQ